MYLEKLEIQGFKSFANKNVLVFPGMMDKTRRGITSIVGPNGSGKSNVADAVRWALGEQSMKTLRGKRSEDIIFSGTEKKGKLGMAEVSLYLNNEDNTLRNKLKDLKKLDVKEGEEKDESVDKSLSFLEFSQIVLTRRIYRNGDSEYLINNSRVRLSDIQMLLAKANFGQKTYSVIGQGTVEGFLNTTLSERKEFFDEATGVKQYQIKRDDSLNKLRASYENLIQAQMLLTEIEPRLKSLTRQVNKLQKREELEQELKNLQIRFYGYVWTDMNSKFRKYNNEFLELEKDKRVKDKKMEILNSELRRMEEESKVGNEFSEWQAKYSRAQNKKEEINRKIARIEAQMEMQLEARGDFDLSFLLSKKEELRNDVKKINEEKEITQKEIDVIKASGLEIENQRRGIESKISSLSAELYSLKTVKKEEESINKHLSNILSKLKSAKEENDINVLRELINKIEEDINRIINISEDGEEKEEIADLSRFKEIQEMINRFTGEKEKSVNAINEINLKASSKNERLRLLSERGVSLANEVNKIEGKLKQSENKLDFKEIGKEKEELVKFLEKEEKDIENIRENISKLNKEEEDKRSRLFSLQKDAQSLQNEINILNNQLNDLKVNSARYETRLEDLEIEIRQELSDLGIVKKHEKNEDDAFRVEDEKRKIKDIKKQLELIGGIDPQVEKEYNETKERYDFLDGQVNDFLKTIDSLEKIIKELDMVIKERFDKEFKLIAENFGKYFKILFNGGTAKVVKVMEDVMVKEESEELEVNSKDKPNEIADIKKIKFLQKHNATGLAGIEIQACPPGKKINSVAMLSGGERALTAIALISAIISANPSPFVFLDEVDAALDEANSERLAQILDDLSHKTQFIAVTHNRSTMKRANILYGVTMGDDGVSKLLSIKFDDAKAQTREVN